MVSEGSDDVNPTIDYPGKDRSRGRDFSSYKENEKSRTRLFKILEKTPLGLLAGVIFALIVLFVLLFIPEYKMKIDMEQVQTLETRLTHLEEAFDKYQGTIERISRLESTMEKKDRLEKRLSRVEGSLLMKMKRVEKKINELAKKKAETASKQPTKQAVTPATQKTTKKKYHTVQKGETIYSICRKYGLEKEELRRLNKLSAGATIHPGQKLILTP